MTKVKLSETSYYNWQFHNLCNFTILFHLTRCISRIRKIGRWLGQLFCNYLFFLIKLPLLLRMQLIRNQFFTKNFRGLRSLVCKIFLLARELGLNLTRYISRTRREIGEERRRARKIGRWLG